MRNRCRVWKDRGYLKLVMLLGEFYILGGLGGPCPIGTSSRIPRTNRKESILPKPYSSPALSGYWLTGLG